MGKIIKGIKDKDVAPWIKKAHAKNQKINPFEGTARIKELEQCLTDTLDLFDHIENETGCLNEMEQLTKEDILRVLNKKQ